MLHRRMSKSQYGFISTMTLLGIHLTGTVKLLVTLLSCFTGELGEPPVPSTPGTPVCDPHGDPPLVGDCWYNCTVEDIAGEDKKQRLRKGTFGSVGTLLVVRMEVYSSPMHILKMALPMLI
uniref:Uncharacterized protein n=1 Tax=Oryza meridionalis TaxID=40149 RepID=A0A0E0D660_9ORYZ